MSRRLRGYPWPSLAISPYHSSPPAGLQDYNPCPHIAAVCKFVLVVPLLHIHEWGSTGVHRLWARPCFSSSVPRDTHIYIYIYIYMYIYIYIYVSSLSWRAASKDFPDSHSPFVSIIHRFRQVLYKTSCVRTEVLLIGSSWSSNTYTNVWRVPLKNVAYEFILTSPKVSCISCSSY